MSPVLVTGGSGYVGSQLLVALLQMGRQVRTTVRSASRETELREIVRRGGADDTELEVCVADLTDDVGWSAAASGCVEVHHVASPIPAVQPANPDALIPAARDGTLRVLRAARDTGARRVVLTSSFVAIGGTPKPGFDYTEADWTDPDTPGLSPYYRSKVIAERAAWEFIERDGGDTELVVVNPTFIFGPTLLRSLSSSTRLVKAMLEGKMSVAPRTRFGVVDVRDLVALHSLAMAAPDASGKRFIATADSPALSHIEVAEILRRRLGPLAARVPVQQDPGEDPPRPTIHNDRARDELGWRPRDAETSIVETAQSMRKLDVLEQV